MCKQGERLCCNETSWTLNFEFHIFVIKLKANHFKIEDHALLTGCTNIGTGSDLAHELQFSNPWLLPRLLKKMVGSGTWAFIQPVASPESQHSARLFKVGSSILLRNTSGRWVLLLSSNVYLAWEEKERICFNMSRLVCMCVMFEIGPLLWRLITWLVHLN